MDLRLHPCSVDPAKRHEKYGPNHPTRSGSSCNNAVCRQHGFSEASYYLWRSKFGGMTVSDAKRLKELTAENTRLKKLLAEAVLDNEVTREALRKKW